GGSPEIGLSSRESSEHGWRRPISSPPFPPLFSPPPRAPSSRGQRARAHRRGEESSSAERGSRIRGETATRRRDNDGSRRMGEGSVSPSARKFGIDRRLLRSFLRQRVALTEVRRRRSGGGNSRRRRRRRRRRSR